MLLLFLPHTNYTAEKLCNTSFIIMYLGQIQLRTDQMVNKKNIRKSYFGSMGQLFPSYPRLFLYETFIN